MLEGPDGPHGVVPVHDRHHDVHQHDVEVGRPLQRRRAPRPRSRRRSTSRGPFEQRRQGEDVPEVVVDHEDLGPLDGVVRRCRRVRAGLRSDPPVADASPSTEAASCSAIGAPAGPATAGVGPDSDSTSHGLMAASRLGAVDGLGDVVVGAGVEAALALPGHHLAGDGDHGQRLEPFDGPDGPDGLVPVHDRHHDVHQHDVDVGLALQDGESLGAALGRDDLGVAHARAAPSGRRCCGSRRRRRGSSCHRSSSSIGVIGLGDDLVDALRAIELPIVTALGRAPVSSDVGSVSDGSEADGACAVRRVGKSR